MRITKNLLTIACLSTAIFTTSARAALTVDFDSKELFKSSTIATGFDPTEPYTPLCRYGDSTYMVWVDANYRALVTQVRDSGEVTTVPVDAQTDYQVQQDGHNRFSIGVDQKGYLHVTGDMHHYSNYTTGTYPLRYQKQQMMYWRSKDPQNLNSGFTYCGQWGSPLCIPGCGWMLGRFFSDNNGVLYYSSMCHAYEASNNNGQMAVGLYKYDVNTGTWSAFGNSVLNIQPNEVNTFPVFYWENAGSGGGWFQNYQANFKFDSQNRLHFAVTSCTNSNLNGPNRLIYAMSPDSGKTWQRANGSIIPSLPIRGIDSQASVGDIVVDSGTQSLGVQPTVAIDKNRVVGVCVDQLWRTWNGSAWVSNQNSLNFTGVLPGSNGGYRMQDGSLIISVNSLSNFLIAPSFTASEIYSYEELPYDGFSNIEESSLRNSNNLYGVGSSKTGNAVTQSIVRTIMTPSTLPSGWSGGDIFNSLLEYKGTTSSNGRDEFIITTQGQGIGDQVDSFYYTRTSLNGDGSIIAQVSSAVQSGANPGMAGVMIRESLNYGSKNASMLLTPATPSALGTAVWSTRAADNNWSSNTTAFNNTLPNPYWVKVVRQGQNFSGYVSSNGAAWTQVGTTISIPMNSNVYIGLAAASGNHGWWMQDTIFDHVVVTGAGSPTPTPSPKPTPTPSPKPTPTPSPKPTPTPSPAPKPPTSAVIISPANGITLTNRPDYPIVVKGTDPVGVTQIHLYVDSQYYAQINGDSGTIPLDTTKMTVGAHQLRAYARNASGGSLGSMPITVYTDNIDPVVTLISPADGAVVGSGIVKIKASATDNVRVVDLHIDVDGVFLSSVKTSSGTFDWDTRKVSKGKHTIRAFAYDAAGNLGGSATHTVTKK